MNLLPIQALLRREEAKEALREFARVLDINDYPHWASQYTSYAEALSRTDSTWQFVKVWRMVAQSFTGGSMSIRDAQASGSTESQRQEQAKRFNPAIAAMERFF